MRRSGRQAMHLVREVKLHMGGAALHGGQDLRGGGAGDGVDLLYLVHLISPRKQREQAHHLNIPNPLTNPGKSGNTSPPEHIKPNDQPTQRYINHNCDQSCC